MNTYSIGLLTHIEEEFGQLYMMPKGMLHLRYARILSTHVKEPKGILQTTFAKPFTAPKSVACKAAVFCSWDEIQIEKIVVK